MTLHFAEVKIGFNEFNYSLDMVDECRKLVGSIIKVYSIIEFQV